MRKSYGCKDFPNWIQSTVLFEAKFRWVGRSLLESSVLRYSLHLVLWACLSLHGGLWLLQAAAAAAAASSPLLKTPLSQAQQASYAAAATYTAVAARAYGAAAAAAQPVAGYAAVAAGYVQSPFISSRYFRLSIDSLGFSWQNEIDDGLTTGSYHILHLLTRKQMIGMKIYLHSHALLDWHKLWIISRDCLYSIRKTKDFLEIVNTVMELPQYCVKPNQGFQEVLKYFTDSLVHLEWKSAWLVR